MIKTIKLGKQFARVIAIKNLNLEVKGGELFGFLGPNAAGKTTTVKLMAGLFQPSEGRVLVGGYDVHREPLKAKALIGYIPDRPFVYEKLKGREFLNLVAGLYDLKEGSYERKREDLLSLFGLREWGDELIEGYSQGMRQKLVFAAALLHNPQVILLDEPMVGLDPKSARLVKDILRDLAKQGVTVFMSTHSLEVVEELCQRIGIIHQGELIALGTMGELRKVAGTEAKRLEEIFLKLTEEALLEETSGLLRGGA